MHSCSLIIRFRPYFLLTALCDTPYSVDSNHLLITDVNAVAASASETVQSLAEKEIFTVPVSGNETLHVTLLLDLIKIIQLVCTKELFPMRMETSKNVLLDKCMLHHCLYYK